MCTRLLWLFHARMIAVALVALGALGGCSNGPDAPPPPAAVEPGLSCHFSYSCPEGTYCDLKRCVQTCNAETACADGLVCTARGRCAESANDPGDPAPQASSGLLRVARSAIAITEQDEVLTLRLIGEGLVRARVESSAAWLAPETEAFEFEGETTLSIPIVHDEAGGEAGEVGGLSAHAATIRVVSTQGDQYITVQRRPAFEGVWSGAISFSGVSQEDGPVDLDLGEAHFTLHVRDDGDGLRAQIDPEESTLWPASASGAVTSYEASAEGDWLELRFAQPLDARSAAPLYPEQSARVFQPATVARALSLRLRVTPQGTLEGAATETIHGLTASPVVIEGAAHLSLRAAGALDEFAASTRPSFPAGPLRDPGSAASTCPPAALPSCVAGEWGCLVDPDQGLLPTGYALSNFFDPDSTRSPVFRFTPENTSGTNTPYAAASAQCLSDLPANLRLDASGVTGSCVDLEQLACARWYSAKVLTGGLSRQGSVYTARAYLELFGMLANESLVQALGRRYTTTASPSELRALYLSAHARYDAGLYRLFDPRLFEELRAVTAVDAQRGAMAPAVMNDRAPLRLAATAIRRSSEMVSAALAIDRITSSDVAALREDAQAHAVLVWLETALAADLEARWRGAAEALPEVLELGAMIRSLNDTIASLTGDETGLGLSRTYVPLLARTSSADVKTNFERLFSLAELSVERSVSADAKANASARAFDQDAAAIGQRLSDARDATVAELAAICGADFIAGGVPRRDAEACGVTSGTARLAVIAAETASLELLRAEQQLEAQYDILESRTATYAAIHEVQSEHIAFVNDVHETLLDARIAEGAKASARAMASGVALGFQSGNTWAVATGAAAGLFAGGAESLISEQRRLEMLLEAEALRVDQEITDLKNAQDLYEAALQFQQLSTQVAIKANEVARAYATIAGLGEQVQRLGASYLSTSARLARVGTLEADPSFRVERSSDALSADGALLAAKRELYLATRALEYETNTPLADIATSVLLAPSAASLEHALACVSSAWNQWRLLVSSTNEYVTEISLARDVLGIRGDATDTTTGETIDAGEQFRRFLFDQPYSPDGVSVWPAIRFGTTLNRSNSLFSSLVCNDRIKTVEVKLLGDGLEGTRAEVQVLADGSSKLRACAASAQDEALVSWNLRPEGQLAPAVVTAGIGAYDADTTANQSLLHYAVSQDTLIVALPDGASSPANRALDPAEIDDIVLRITHTGVAVGSATAAFKPTCN